MTSREATPESPLLAEQWTRQLETSISDLNEEQQTVLHELESIENTWIVNIQGSSGSGKTFLGWALAREYDEWSYRPWVPTSPVEATKIVIDNVAPKRVASRRVRELVNFDDVDLVVALSREPVPEIHARIRLSPPTDE